MKPTWWSVILVLLIVGVVAFVWLGDSSQSEYPPTPAGHSSDELWHQVYDLAVEGGYAEACREYFWEYEPGKDCVYDADTESWAVTKIN